jgi:beta-lysine 5,6-aminomutase alpha subunit
MMLNVDTLLIGDCEHLASDIASKMHSFISPRSTIAVERAVLRLAGISGAREQYPLVNIVADSIGKEIFRHGVAFSLVNAIAATGKNAQTLAEQVADERLDLDSFPIAPEEKRRVIADELRKAGLERIERQRQRRQNALQQFGERPTPWRYVIVASGNIFEDIDQALAAVGQGADIIAVIRSTAQSLMDYVPEGATTEGFGGTYATQENFRIMRDALDELSKRLGRYVRLTNYASGLCMPEMAMLGALERLDMMLSDSMYGILFRDINMQRTLVDQHFARRIQALAGIIINTGEDNYLTTDDAFNAAHTVLASQFINRAFAHRSGLPDRQIGLGHAFEMNPLQESGLLLEIADALLSRTCFPNCPLKYMPPTRHVTGDIFQAHVMNALFNLTSVATMQHIHLVGMPTEGVHTPFMQDRAIALKSVEYITHYAKGISDEFLIREDGIINQRGRTVLQAARDLLSDINETGMFESIEQGQFANIKRNRNGGKGLEGVFVKSDRYLSLLPDDYGK